MFRAEDAAVLSATKRAEQIAADIENMEKEIRMSAAWGRMMCTYKCYPYSRTHLEDMLANAGYKVSKHVGTDGDKLILTIYW